MTTTGWSLHVVRPTHVAGHTLDFIFMVGQGEGDPKVKDVKTGPVSWSEHLLFFRLTVVISLCRDTGPIKTVHLPRQMVEPERMRGRKQWGTLGP